MPDIFIFADAIAYPQLKTRLRGRLDKILAENIAPVMGKTPAQIKTRLIAVDTGEEVANIQIMLTSTVLLNDQERTRLSEKCADAIIAAWKIFMAENTLENVVKVDTQVFLLSGTWKSVMKI
jgi:hypothetical protein